MSKRLFKSILAWCLTLSTQVQASSSSNSSSNSSETLQFVFELVRHGARSSADTDFNDGFKVGKEELTAQGMRARHLLGRYNRQRYVEDYQLINATQVPGEVFIQSTYKHRTLQSGYSEYLGLFPPKDCQPEPVSETAIRGRGAPPFNIRNSWLLNFELGQKALPHQFCSSQIHTFQGSQDTNDDVADWHCTYQFETSLDMSCSWHYKNFDWIAYFTRPAQTALWNQPETEITDLYDAYKYEDGYIARTHEGLDFPGNDTFDNTTYYMMRNTQKIFLGAQYSQDSRRLVASRLFRRPLALMQHQIDCILANESCEEPDALIELFPSNLKYLIYSAHDSTLIFSLEWLNPTNLHIDWIDFSSQLITELWADQDCIDSGAQDETCFRVDLRYNGQSLAFDECTTNRIHRNATGCTWSEWLSYMDRLWFHKMDLDEACSVLYKRHEQFNQKSYSDDLFQ